MKKWSIQLNYINTQLLTVSRCVSFIGSCPSGKVKNILQHVVNMSFSPLKQVQCFRDRACDTTRGSTAPMHVFHIEPSEQPTESEAHWGVVCTPKPPFHLGFHTAGDIFSTRTGETINWSDKCYWAVVGGTLWISMKAVMTAMKSEREPSIHRRHQYLGESPFCYKLSKWSVTGIGTLHRPFNIWGLSAALQAVTQPLLFSSAGSVCRKWLALSFSPAQYYSLPFSKQYHNISWCHVKMAQIGSLKSCKLSSNPLSVEVTLSSNGRTMWIGPLQMEPSAWQEGKRLLWFPLKNWFQFKRGPVRVSYTPRTPLPHPVP